MIDYHGWFGISLMDLVFRLDDQHLRVCGISHVWKPLTIHSGIQRPLKSIREKSQSIYIPRRSLIHNRIELNATFQAASTPNRSIGGSSGISIPHHSASATTSQVVTSSARSTRTRLWTTTRSCSLRVPWVRSPALPRKAATPSRCVGLSARDTC